MWIHLTLSRRGYMTNLPKISRFPDFIQYFSVFSQRCLDFSQRFPDFSLTKFFKVRKCERCGSLNPRMGKVMLYRITVVADYNIV